MQVWGYTPDRNGWNRTIDTLDMSQLLSLLSYVPRTPPGADFLAVLRKPPAFMPLASIVFYNDFSDLSDLFLFYITFFEIFITNM